MHPPATPRHSPPAQDAEFVATRDIALPSALWAVAMAAVVSGALVHATIAPPAPTPPQQPAAVLLAA